jgi:hypothetical protein
MTDGIGNLIGWLRDQLDDDEQTARAAKCGESDVFDDTGIIVMHAATGTRSVTLTSAVASHIARHDPDRTLAKIDANRNIVELCHSSLVAFNDDGEKELARDVLRRLALPYADHPGYQAAWWPR